MNSKNNDAVSIIKIVFLSLGELFAVISVIRFITEGVWTRTVLAGLTIPLLLLPMLIERLLKQKLTLPAFILGIVYAIGPALGHSYGLYYILPWWDELLHFTGGAVFALLGFEISRKLCKDKASEVSIWLIALFGLCFSIAISALWEFAEYGTDLLLEIDMQCDTIVNSISSYKLGPEAGITGNITNIEEVMINGQPLGVGGYLDIGLHDTMTDMLSEFAGAVIATVMFFIRKGRSGLFQ